MPLILVVEDEPGLRRGLQDNLEDEGHQVLTAPDGRLGYQLATETRPDLLILDLMVPHLSGEEVCRRLRADGRQLPILVLTARGDEHDRVRLLDLGADDYVVKPFSLKELLARVRALLRRAKPGAELPVTAAFGTITVDFLAFECRRDSKLIDLTPKEFALLRLLASRPSVAISRNEMLDLVWGLDANPGPRTVDNHMANLRHKLERDAADPRYLLTVHGVGYRFCPEGQTEP